MRSTYNGYLRNQIRQAERNGLGLRAFLLASTQPEPRAAAYARYLPIHEQSWRRTGMTPHDPAHWQSLSTAIAEAGGVDLVVLALDGDTPVAGATCHLFREQALYWSGGSLPDGLTKRANPL